MSDVVAAPSQAGGLKYEAKFFGYGNAFSPFDFVKWTKRDVKITGSDGKVFFEQKEVEVPEFWSQTATTIVAQKYFRGQLGTAERESSVRQLIGRVATTIAEFGWNAKYFDRESSKLAFQNDLTYLLLHQMMSFNSPVWFNVGVDEKPQCSACFITNIEDSMSSILDLCKTEGMLFKGGSGTGVNLSKLRSAKEPLKGGGQASGPVTFMRGFDAFAGVIKSGGKTRRAAKMVILDVDHPDIVEFVECKAREERKAHALIDAGFDGAFNVPGGAYDTIAYQNANHSVRVTDDFMRAVEKDEVWITKERVSGADSEAYTAKDLWRKIAEAAHQCGDPGVQFDTTINEWHTCPAHGRIEASNPCSEYMFLNNTACNLASLNLMKFRKAEVPGFDTVKFCNAVRVTILAQEIIVSMSRYPTTEIAANSECFRPLGLGYANLGALLMTEGVAYDSDRGRYIAGAITSLMTAAAYEMSAKLASIKGPFAGHAKNSVAMQEIVKKHRSRSTIQLQTTDQTHANDAMIAEAAFNAWHLAYEKGLYHGYRNSQVTVLAPTGTIGFMMDVDTTGIEPPIALVAYKSLVGGGTLKIVNASVVSALTALGYDERQAQVVMNCIAGTGEVDKRELLDPSHYEVFACALGKNAISAKGHVDMMAAVQPFLSGAISKTVNMPNSATVEDIAEIYRYSWKMGLKAVAVYRDGCKRTQPMSTKLEVKKVTEEKPHDEPRAVRRKLPKERQSITHKFSIGGHEGYITVGMYEDGGPGEIFCRMAKEGSTFAGLVDSFSIAISLALQHGVPLDTLIEKFKSTRFEPSGFTGNPELPRTTSIMDYIFRWLELRFVTNKPKQPLRKDLGDVGIVCQTPVELTDHAVTLDSPACNVCGTLMVRSGSCYCCPACGTTSGCS